MHWGSNPAVADFKGTSASKTKERVHLLRRARDAMYILNCCGCRKKCVGSCKLRKNITDAYRSKVAKLDGKGVFRKKPNNNGSKHGSMNIAANGDNNGGDGAKATKTTSTPSTITDGQPTYDRFFAIAKLAGVVNANARTTKEDENINGICEDYFSWDVDILADIGGRISPSSRLKDKAVSITQQRVEGTVQGRRGSNPFRVKTKPIGTKDALSAAEGVQTNHT